MIVSGRRPGLILVISVIIITTYAMSCLYKWMEISKLIQEREVELLALRQSSFLEAEKQKINPNWKTSLCLCTSPLSSVKSVASGGWIYDEALISSQHVAYDAGLGKEIIRIVDTYTPNRGQLSTISIGDIGAGVGQFGTWLQSQDNSWLEWHGFDGGNNINEFCQRKVALVDQKEFNVPKVCYIDASINIDPSELQSDGAPWDWVMSIEVAEHIPAEFQDVYIDNIIKLAKYGLIISWAIPGQGGHQHVNELSNEVVVKLMEDKGLKYLKEESDIARQRVERLSWLKNTVMIFTKG